MMGPEFEVWESPRNGKWYFHLRSRNGEIIAAGQGYTRKEDCVDGVRAVKDQAPIARITYPSSANFPEYKRTEEEIARYLEMVRNPDV